MDTFRMTELAVGKPFPLVRGKSEGCFFFIHNEGMYLIANFDTPTDHEIAQMKSSARFEIRWTTVDGIIVITTKLGTLNWIDAPFAPQLEIARNRLNLDTISHGLPLTLILTDARTTNIRVIRMIGISVGFTSSLITAMRDLAHESLDISAYNAIVNGIFRKYSTTVLANMGASNAFLLAQFEQSGVQHKVMVSPIANDEPPLRKSLEDIAAYVSKRPCQSLDIPEDLEPYHYYIADAGHCIQCVPRVFLADAQRKNDMDGYETPVPAKYVLEKGYERYGDYLIADVPYDPELGVVVDDRYSVF